jgi:hypothetical protein
MATRSREVLVSSFNSVSSGQGGSFDRAFGTDSSLASALDELTRQASQLIAGAGSGLANPVESDSSENESPLAGGLSNARRGELYTVDVSAQSGSRLNTSPTVESVGQATAASGTGSSALSIASTIFESGLGIVPLVSGLLGLFGGGSSTPPALERYIMPDRLYFTGADGTSGIGNADYDQFGMPRFYGGTSSMMTSPSGPAPGSAATLSSSPQINVTVQAMDSQSFLDHSSEIAQAVRQAMLNSNSVNDVVNDL